MRMMRIATEHCCGVFGEAIGDDERCLEFPVMELSVWFWCLGYDFFKTSMLGEGGCSWCDG